MTRVPGTRKLKRRPTYDEKLMLLGTTIRDARNQIAAWMQARHLKRLSPERRNAHRRTIRSLVQWKSTELRAALWMLDDLMRRQARKGT